MRGTLSTRGVLQYAHGIIPAYAGNTICLITLIPAVWDHPRVCGEHFGLSTRHGTREGSSPRMRGTPQEDHQTSFTNGIIPAYAGNTTYLTLALLAPRDHPRVCGEHAPPRAVSGCPWGSSPRMRGTLALRGSLCKLFGIIPAYAGNTRHRLSGRDISWDHPRVCGEHRDGGGRSVGLAGSSPRMRGTHGEFLEVRRRLGIIPAYAGNTYDLFAHAARYRDHPRVCGEHAR